jgi:hypothetical protein
MDNNQLYHWGIKGMKWGVRRYQNEDGSLTAAGKKRMSEGDIQSGKRVLDESSQMANKLKNATDASIRNAKNDRPRMDLSNMTDKQMRDEINRALLERQYNEMFAPQKSTKGRETVSRALEVAGNVLAIGSTALGIAVAIKQLTGKG